jgi:hypothetical protein
MIYDSPLKENHSQLLGPLTRLLEKSTSTASEYFAFFQHSLFLFQDLLDSTPDRGMIEYDIFISHAFTHHSLISYVYRSLYCFGRYRIFYDQCEPGGDNGNGNSQKSFHDAMIARRLTVAKKARFILLCLSSTYQENDFCLKELQRMIEKEKRKVILILEENSDKWLSEEVKKNCQLPLPSSSVVDIGKWNKEFTENQNNPLFMEELDKKLSNLHSFFGENIRPVRTLLVTSRISFFFFFFSFSSM